MDDLPEPRTSIECREAAGDGLSGGRTRESMLLRTATWPSLSFPPPVTSGRTKLLDRCRRRKRDVSPSFVLADAGFGDGSTDAGGSVGESGGGSSRIFGIRSGASESCARPR